METTRPTFGTLLRRYRVAAGLSQEALAERAGLSARGISDLERGARRVPHPATLELLADALALAPADRARLGGVVNRRRGPLAAQPPAPPLPLPPTPLIGREAELRALDGLLADPGARLVTIVAPGGMGKSRLALAVAEGQRAAPRFPDGVRFVELAALTGADQLAPALAAALDLAGDRDRADGATWDRLVDALRERHLLLVLDNVEQVRDGAERFAALLAAAPGVAILATSRERLGLRGEQAFPLGGLPVPDAADDLAAFAAPRLFIAAARRARPDFDPAADLPPIGAICRLVGGMPLALELAAPWVAVLPPAAIAAELGRGLDLLSAQYRDLPPRQRSIRAVCAAAWLRLDEAARAAFARLSVCRGGFDRQAAAAIAGAGPATLARLADAALLAHDRARDRYAIHEVLRGYGAEQLAGDPAGEGRARDAHAAHYCARVAALGPAPGDPDGAAGASLAPERDNIRAAWLRAAGQDDRALLGAALDGLTRFCERHATAEDGAAACEAAAIALADQTDADDGAGAWLLARLLVRQGAFCRRQGRIDEAEALLRRGLALLDRAAPADHDPRVERALALLELGRLAYDRGRDDAQAHLEASLALARAAGRDREAGTALWELGRLAYRRDRFAVAEGRLREALARCEGCGDRAGVAQALIFLSQIAAETGRLSEAEGLARRSHDLFAALGDRAGLAGALRRLGLTLMWQGRAAEALPLGEESLALCRALGLRAEQGFAHYYLSGVHFMLGAYGPAEEHARRALAIDRDLGSPTSLANDHWTLGMALAGRGHWPRPRRRCARAWRWSAPTAAPTRRTGRCRCWPGSSGGAAAGPRRGRCCSTCCARWRPTARSSPRSRRCRPPR